MSFGALLGAVGTGAGAFFGGPAGAAVGGSIGASIGSGFDQANANKENVRLSQDQMRFQERMSSTAHQRQVADLKKAGLNPILSVNSGASSQPGSLPQIKSVSEGMAASAVETAQLYQAFKKNDAELKLMNAQTNKTNTEAQVIKKGIPEADLKNKIYDSIRPVIDKLTGATKSTAKSIEKMSGIKESEQHKRNMKDFDWDAFNKKAGKTINLNKR